MSLNIPIPALQRKAWGTGRGDGWERCELSSAGDNTAAAHMNLRQSEHLCKTGSITKSLPKELQAANGVAGRKPYFSDTAASKLLLCQYIIPHLCS